MPIIFKSKSLSNLDHASEVISDRSAVTHFGAAESVVSPCSRAEAILVKGTIPVALVTVTHAWPLAMPHFVGGAGDG